MKPGISSSRGFTLVEIMITLALGLIISGALVQIMVSNSVTERLNRAIASAQENGRFAIGRLRNDLLMTGRYDRLDPDLNLQLAAGATVDVVEEENFLLNHPVPLPGDFPAYPDIGAIQGDNGDSDTLVISMLDERDCRGYQLGYPDGDQFFVVNQYFVDDNKLKCRGFDGRVLRGQKNPVGNNGDAAYTLLDDVESFQVLYGVTDMAMSGDNTGRPVSFVSAAELAPVLANFGQVVAIRVAVLVKGDGEINIDPVPTFKLLNEAPIQPGQNRLYKQFETTVTLRNVKNFMRSRKI